MSNSTVGREERHRRTLSQRSYHHDATSTEAATELQRRLSFNRRLDLSLKEALFDASLRRGGQIHVNVGTISHIDHHKTNLTDLSSCLRSLTG